MNSSQAAWLFESICAVTWLGFCWSTVAVIEIWSKSACKLALVSWPVLALFELTEAFSFPTDTVNVTVWSVSYARPVHIDAPDWVVVSWVLPAWAGVIVQDRVADGYNLLNSVQAAWLFESICAVTWLGFCWSTVAVIEIWSKSACKLALVTEPVLVLSLSISEVTVPNPLLFSVSTRTSTS